MNDAFEEWGIPNWCKKIAKMRATKKKENVASKQYLKNVEWGLPNWADFEIKKELVGTAVSQQIAPQHGSMKGINTCSN